MSFGKRFQTLTSFIFYILENISICNWKQFQSLISIPFCLQHSIFIFTLLSNSIRRYNDFKLSKYLKNILTP